MSWLWIGVSLGLIAPWVVSGQSIKIAFEERGFLGGIAVWSGMCFLAVPFMVLISWLGSLLT